MSRKNQIHEDTTIKLRRYALRRHGEKTRGTRVGSRLGLYVMLGIGAGALLTGHKPPPAADWPMFGQNLANTAANVTEEDISTKQVGALKPKWTFTTGGDVSARAAVVDGVAYFPDWGGNLWAVNADTGKLIWSHQLSYYGLAANTISRTSPAVVNGIVYIGTQYVASGPTGWLLAIQAATGHLLWKTQPDASIPFPVITGSPTVASGMVFVGMTSAEEAFALDPYTRAARREAA
jgi:polyvinyl alcohol dehydrogenase (cytochrome)